MVVWKAHDFGFLMGSCLDIDSSQVFEVEFMLYARRDVAGKINSCFNYLSNSTELIPTAQI